MMFSLDLYLLGVLMVLVQAAAAVPWLALLNRDWLRAQWRQGKVSEWKRWLGQGVLGVCLLALVPAILMSTNRDRTFLVFFGGVYAVVLHVQMIVDCFVVALAALLKVWPKGMAVALAAFREGWRLPLFWLLLVVGSVLLLLWTVLPYFTFGEDVKVVKELGYDTIMLAAALFGVVTAGMSISEEIEGRTAVTLMSKPVSRRQFLIGKFLGILLAAGLLTSALGWFFCVTLLRRLSETEFGDPMPVPPGLDASTDVWTERWGEVQGYYLWGAAYWVLHVVAALPGILLGFCQTMVLTAVAAALATRLPMIMNLVICFCVFLLGHLTPILQQVSQTRFALVRFIADLFYYVLPGLELFNLGPAIVRDTPPEAGPFTVYVGTITLYAVLYTAIALLFGLVLFEDRDLA